MRLKSDVTLDWVENYRPECPVCQKPTVALSSGYRDVETRTPGKPHRIARLLVDFPLPCGCFISDEQSLTMQRAAVAAGGMIL